MAYDPIRSEDHEDRGPLRFLQQFKEKPKLEAWLRTYLRQVQKLEAAVWEVVDLRLLDNATGIQLDRIGRIVGRGRGDMVDEVYRQAIRAQIRINRSEGTPLDLSQVADLSVPPGSDISFEFQEGVASVLVHMIGQAIGAINGPLVWYNLNKSRAAGVRLHLVYSDDLEQRVFRYGGQEGAAALAPGSYTVTWTDQVFTDENDPEDDGGKLASVVGA